MRIIHVDHFDQWRDAARELLAARCAPQDVTWRATSDAQELLWGEGDAPAEDLSQVRAPSVSRAFVQVAHKASFHRDPSRWGLLYQMLWRLTHGEPRLMEVRTDEQVRRLMGFEREVRRDAHKMKAFVRFRRVERQGREYFIAWHRPDHLIVPLVAPFFEDRFRGMCFSILTPDASMHWDGQRLVLGQGASRQEAPDEDVLEQLWVSYYKSIFNPARIKLKAMQSEMPQKHWPTMPETQVITQMLREAPERVRSMVAAQPLTAKSLVPRGADLPALHEALLGCDACGACAKASGPVMGAGPSDARLALVGEQPGDHEDRQGEPFVGPAGEVLDRALAEAGLDRNLCYLTNATKGFRFEPRGHDPVRRVHVSPKPQQVEVCKPWMVAELRALEPEVVVALGRSAALALTGRQVHILKERGVHRSPMGRYCVVTLHPSAVLRAQGTAQQQRLFGMLVNDLRQAASFLQNASIKQVS